MNRRALIIGSAAAVFLAAGTAMAAPATSTPAKGSGKAAPTKVNAKATADSAKAGPSNVSGKVLRIDVANRTVTLADGQYYNVPSAVNIDGVKAGDQVTMSVDKNQYGIFTVEKLNKS